MKKFFLLGMMVCLTIVASAQRSMDWYAYWGSNETGSQIDPQRMAVDKDGNVYVAALYGGDKVKVGEKTLVSQSAADKGDAVIIKVSPSGSVLWVYSLVNQGSATVADLAVDGYGNIFVLGAYNKSINVGTKTMPVDDTNMGEAALYVLKLRADGTAVRAWEIAALGAKAGGLAIDSKNNVIITGLLDGDATLTWGGEVMGDFNNDAQLIVAKYTNSGSLVWYDFRCDGQASYSKPSVAVDANDNVYVGTALAGSTTFNGKAIAATASNAVLLAYSAAGTEKWSHMIDGDEADEAGAVAVSPIGQVVLAVNHHSGDLRIDDMEDVFNNGYAFDAAFTHTAFFAFDLAGEFKWFYNWGYSNGTEGSDAVCYALRCTDEGVWYAAGMMTGRHGGSRLPDEIGTLPKGKNSGVETIDNQWMQHNTNGGQDSYLLTLTRGGKLANVVRPGGPQYEYGIDVALTPDKKGLYFLMQINVRNKAPYTCPNNLFDSWTDLDGKGRKGNYTVLNVFCPENDGSSTAYTTAYKGVFASSLLVKYAMPEINPNKLPYFTLSLPYSQELSILNPQGKATLYPLEKYADVTFENNTVSGTFDNDMDRYVGVLAIDSIALPGEITYYEYDKNTHQSIRSNPRNLRYLALTIEIPEPTPATDPDQPAEPVIPSEIEEGLEHVNATIQGQKFMIDGVLYIQRNGKLYNAQGAQVR
ncbi:MAG: hypothetical protein IJQ32_05115 [Paludibacteraceae bacterium]|nr:hypothetical protein [Paludibacteraceae bacterium]